MLLWVSEKHFHCPNPMILSIKDVETLPMYWSTVWQDSCCGLWPKKRIYDCFYDRYKTIDLKNKLKALHNLAQKTPRFTLWPLKEPLNCSDSIPQPNQNSFIYFMLNSNFPWTSFKFTMIVNTVNGNLFWGVQVFTDPWLCLICPSCTTQQF